MNTTANHTKRLIPMAAALLLTAGLAGCADEGGLGGDTGGTTAGTTGGTTSGTTAGTTGGTTAGTTAGTTGGTTAGTTAGTTGGTTAGTTAGTTGGTTAGTTAGTTGGTTAGTTAGTTGGTTAGTTAGTTGGTTAGTTGGTTAGTTGGDTTGGTTGGSTGGSSGGTTGGVVGGIICNPTSLTFRPIVQPDGVASGQTNGICIGCSVTAPENVVDNDVTTVAALNTPIGLLTGSSQLNVVDTAQTYPAGRRAGFTLFDPAGALLTLNLLQSVRISVALNGNEVDSATVPTNLALDLLGETIVGTNDPQYLSFVPTSDFNEVRISFGGNIANVLAQLGIIQACVSVNDAILP